MNERIKELMKQATVPGYMLGESYVQSRLDEQKFAELIVNECADMVAGSSLPDAYSEPVLEEIAEEMREWFGVSK